MFIQTIVRVLFIRTIVRVLFIWTIVRVLFIRTIVRVLFIRTIVRESFIVHLNIDSTRSPMKPDFVDAIGLEIKKELAERYFGFRKLVEEDKIEFSEKVKQYTFILEKRISFDLLRLYSLLGSEKNIHTFLKLIKLPEDNWPRFYHSVLNEEGIILQRVFEGLRIRGLTRKGRFTNLLLDCYENLSDNALRYQGKFSQLLDKAALINEEIRFFHRQNNLGTILGFLHSLGDSTRYGDMQGGLETGIADSLEKKMAIPLLDPVEKYLPKFPDLPEIKDIRWDLTELAASSFVQHSPEMRDFFTSMKKPAPRPSTLEE